MEIRVRFAPSPTGQVHIGNIRTAIFNWLFARHAGGKFLLRIEDTDRERSTQEAIDKLLECMDWLGLTYDEEIFYQSKRVEAHVKAAEYLLEKGHAYRPEPKKGESVPVIFRIPWDTDNNPFVRVVGEAEIETHPDMPVKIDANGVFFAQVSKKGKPVDSTACLAGFHHLKIFDAAGGCIFKLDDNIGDILEKRASFQLEKCKRLIFQRREIFYNDIIKGGLAKPLDSMKDLVIVRSDGFPVFHLANVSDDVEQRITHIIRGDDHVENTYRHIFLFQALGYEVPKYAHLPMIVNQVGKPYSKRDGDAFVGDFRTKGYLSEALFNYLSFLGWSPGDGREKLSRDELIKTFALERVLSSPAQFDMTKLLNLNGLYMAEMNVTEFVECAWREAITQGWADNVEYGTFLQVARLMHSRTKLITQVETWKNFFFDDIHPAAGGIEYDQDAVKKFLALNEVRIALELFKEQIVAMKSFDEKSIESEVRKAEAAAGLAEGRLNQPLRIAATGLKTGAGIYETAALLGRERVAVRIKRALALKF